MRKYIIVDSVTGNVNSMVQWNNINNAITEFPADWVFNENEELVISDDSEDIQVGDVYDFILKKYYILEPVEPVISKSDLEIVQEELELAKQNIIENQSAIDFILNNY